MKLDTQTPLINDDPEISKIALLFRIHALEESHKELVDFCNTLFTELERTKQRLTDLEQAGKDGE